VNKYFVGLLSLFLLSSCSWFTSPPSRAENPVIRGVDYIGMTVSDIDKSSELYALATDLQSVEKTEFNTHPVIDTLAGKKGVQASAHLMKSVNAQLRLMEFKNPSEVAKATPYLRVYGPGIAHVCYQVAKKTRTYETFLENGGTHIGDPEMVHLNPKNPVYYAYAHDHDNILFEVEHVDVEALNLPAPPKNDYRIRHVSLATSDMDRLVEFYSTLLETQNPRRAGTLINLSGEKLDKVSGEPGSEIEMAWFQVRNIELEIIQYHSPKATALETPRPFDSLGYNSIVFDVADMQVAKTLFLKAGGIVISEPQSMDEGQIMFGHDPDGNLLGFQVISSNSPLSSQNFQDNGT
jgi:catechol 2,3-dioxygenase-like lactoylglutathione lyase family enzyme